LLSAKELHPGKRNSLDALCERYFIDNSKRTLHGALADALLLAECYLAMTRGQESLMMELEAPAAAAAAAAGLILDVSKLIVQSATSEELLSHEQYLDAMEKESRGPSLWRKLLAS
jgi:DNA polymerase-3 subunit epsilon